MFGVKPRLFSSGAGSAKVYKKVTHCIFDMDGTVLDSESIYHKMLRKICSSYGKNYTKEMELKLYGGTDRDVCSAVVKELSLPISVDEMERQLTALSDLMLPDSPMKRGAERLLMHLHKHDIPIALATNSTEHAVRLHSRTKPRIFNLFHHMVSVTEPEVDRGKPHPDIYLLTASRFQERPKPYKCLVFEDSERGLAAAKAAGMQVVMIPDIKMDRERTRGATLVLRTMLDFKPELFGLPPFPPLFPPRPYHEIYSVQKDTNTDDTKDKDNKNIVQRYLRDSLFQEVCNRRSVRVSLIDKLLERKSEGGQSNRLSVIDQLLQSKSGGNYPNGYSNDPMSILRTRIGVIEELRRAKRDSEQDKVNSNEDNVRIELFGRTDDISGKVDENNKRISKNDEKILESDDLTRKTYDERSPKLDLDAKFRTRKTDVDKTLCNHVENKMNAKDKRKSIIFGEVEFPNYSRLKKSILKNTITYNQVNKRLGTNKTKQNHKNKCRY